MFHFHVVIVSQLFAHFRY